MIEQHDPLQQMFDEAQVDLPDALQAKLAAIPVMGVELPPVSKWRIAALVPLAAAAVALVMPYAIKMWNPFYWNLRVLISRVPLPPLADLVHMPVQLSIAIVAITVIMGGAAYLIFSYDQDYLPVQFQARR